MKIQIPGIQHLHSNSQVQTVNDEINFPKHYTSHPSGFESIQITEHFWFNLSAAGKYVWRAGLKNPERPDIDLQKAVWYLRREASRIKEVTKRNKEKYPYAENNGEHPLLTDKNIKDVLAGFDYPLSHTYNTIISCGTSKLYKDKTHSDLIVHILNISANFLEKNIPVICNGMPLTEEPNLVNNPKHYNAHPSGIEAIDLVEGFHCNIGHAMKYVWRAGLKEDNPKDKDYKKAAWYINREIDRIKKFNINYPFVYSSHSTLSDSQITSILKGFDDDRVKIIIGALITVGLGRVKLPEDHLLLALAELGELSE